jgi:hypothetical protein
MQFKLNFWLGGLAAFLTTFAPLVFAARHERLAIAIAVFAVNVLGVAASRRYFKQLAGRSGQRAAQDIGESHALPQSPWHALVHGAGMGFGICAVLALGYLAWYFEL